MDITRRDGLRLAALLAGLGALPVGLGACGTEPGPQVSPADPGTLGLAAADVRRSDGSPADLPDVVASLHGLSGGLFGELARTPGNLVISPYSVVVALAMTLNGALGATAAEMRDVLGVEDVDRFNAGLNALTQHVEGLAGEVQLADGSRGELVLAAANQLFGQRDTTWRKPFLATLAREYGAGMRLVDYTANVEGARGLINSWTAEQTRERIPEIVPEGVLDGLTRLVLVNALYLKAPWSEPFEPELTTPAVFRTAAGARVEVPMMHRGLASTGFTSGPGWVGVRLPYAGDGLAMTILLPDDSAMPALIDRVSGGELPQMLAGHRPTGVLLTMPRWEFRTASPLREALVGLGMPTAFDRVEADFAGMTTDEELHVSAVLHEGFIAVNEEGTEAAAATAAVMAGTSMPVFEQTVVVDRPFLFVIHDLEHGTPLFLGRVDDPS
ncbi:serpin family protein [Nocardioides sp.]|uniref:serpin family protein n=1 Tax=Nocardioides sp. TaxID=35761 RepID=UPI0035633B83